MDGLKLTRLIACGLTLMAIADLPYVYYQFLRMAITIIAGINAVSVAQRENKTLLIAFFAVAILFNPLIPIYLDKETWTSIDLLIGLFFGAIAFIKTIDNNEKNSA